MQSGDRNSNALPGTLVEQDVTHPFEYDFYLCAHSAIQGTARPVHYHVLRDDAKVPVVEFQKMIYHFSYQYMRSTTPVSLCKSSKKLKLTTSNHSQSRPSTMLTWLPIVLVPMSLLPLRRALVAVRSLRRLIRMLWFVLPFVVLPMTLLRLALPCPPRPLLWFPWATRTWTRSSFRRSEPACGTYKRSLHLRSCLHLLLLDDNNFHFFWWFILLMPF